MKTQLAILMCGVMLFSSGCGRGDEKRAATETSDGIQSSAQAIIGDWTPYQVDDTPINALSPYLNALSSGASIAEPLDDPLKRIEGFPENYPYDLIPPVAVRIIHETSDEDGDFWISMDATVPYAEAVTHYRDLLSDKPSFQEYSDGEGEITFYALVTKWEVSIRLMDWNEDGTASVEISLYDKSTED